MFLKTWYRKGIFAARNLHWNFFRIHLACFTFIPLITSGILYAGNAGSSGDARGTDLGIQRVEYVDCLFLCYSAMTTTGLVTVNLSALHPFQQAVLLILAIIGDVSFVALLMVLVRKRFFRVHCQKLLANDQLRRSETNKALEDISTSKLQQRAVQTQQISRPVSSELLNHYSPDRILADPPLNQSSIEPEDNQPVLARHDLRMRTLGHKTINTQAMVPASASQSGLGGFPILTQIGKFLVSAIKLPVRDERAIHTVLTREATVLEDKWSDSIRHHVVSWLPDGFDGLIVGRNSRFYTEELEDEQLEQIGGVEYRALRFLSYFVAGYIFLSQIIPFAILSAYFSATQYWSSAFQSSAGVQIGSIDPVWASLYFSIGAYSGAGLTLVDQSIVPFSSCYLLVWVLNITMLLGNHAFPMTLRFLIWFGTKMTGRTSLNQTLHFLLDHPRRCFLYLFPSHQTWYLVLALVAFIVIEMFSFLVLNIGLPVLDSLGTEWQKFSDGLLQSLSVRASGFGIVAVPNLSPSTLFLYVVLMYVAIYPIALSVRSTNVYEEQALGVYHNEDPKEDAEPTPDAQKASKPEIFSKYLMWHVRRQLAFDIWPLALAVFVIACFERGKLMGDKSSWFTIFRIIFECTSGYSLIGLSLGTPNNNYSFCGEFTVMSKIVIMLVMLRGRHRGLPVAIDRAVMLPQAFSR